MPQRRNVMATAKKTAVAKATLTLPALDAGFTSEQRELIRSQIAKGCGDDELALFLHVCQTRGLDPMTRQIYAIKRGGQMTIQIGIDGARSMAARTGRYMPGREPTFTFAGKALEAATVYIKVLGPDKSWHETSDTAYLAEFKGNTPLWSKMPRVMLSKCAEMRVLRRAFPDDLGGIYGSEEMDQASSPATSTGPLEIIAPSIAEDFPEPRRIEATTTGEKIANEVFAEAIDSEIAEEVEDDRDEETSLDDLAATAVGGRVVARVITEVQCKRLFATMDEFGLDYKVLRPKILAAYGIGSIKELPADKLESLIGRLTATATAA
jgi:phage recombination protein Bet